VSSTLQPPARLPNTSQTLGYRFSVFELDLDGRELRRNGTKLRLQDQPFQVLRKLLERAGSIVTREELQSALWADDTFVDFDTSLNTAIKRLREVLGDSADLPVFVETIPRRGYRFIAPVEVHRAQEASDSVAPVTAAAPADKRRLLDSRSKVGLACLGLVLAGGAGALATWLRSPIPAPRIIDSTQMTFDGVAKTNFTVGGGQIFYNESFGDHTSLLRLPETGGLPATLDSSTPGLFVGAVSSDGSMLLLGSPHKEFASVDVKAMDLTSASIRNLGSIVANDGSWAPNGGLLLSRSGVLYLTDSNGSNERKMLSLSGFIYHMRYSPDKKRIRFTLANKFTSASHIWEAAADGTNAHELFPGINELAQVCCGEWTPDGRYYTFLNIRNGVRKVWISRASGSFWDQGRTAPMQLTTEPLNFNCAVPSHDGKKLFVCAQQPRAQLERFDAASGEFVPYLSGMSAGEVEVSRDGTQLVYVKYPQETLWRSKTDGSGAEQLTGPSLRVALPHWSPDGKRIAFSGAKPGHPWNIFWISSQGGVAEQVSHGGFADLDATWSPDGGTLAFGLTEENQPHGYSIQMLDVVAGRQTKLNGSDGICCPRWSPDGRYLIATSSANDDLLLYEFSTGHWSLLRKDFPHVGYMAWTKSSKEVIFDTYEVKEPFFYKLHVPGGQIEPVVPLNDIRRYYGEWGSWSGLAPDGSPLIVRDISNEEIYALDWQLP